MTDYTQELLELIEVFLSGNHQSRELADRIESVVLQRFTHEAWFDEVSLALAQFAPHAGSEYYDERALAEVLEVAAIELRRGLASSKGARQPPA